MQNAFKHTGFAGFIGVAREDISPPVGIFFRNWGAAENDAAIGIHRPLYLTALCLQEHPSAQPLVLIDADLGWFADINFGRRFIQDLLMKLALPPERVIFAMSHTHSAPPLVDPEEQWQGGELLPAFCKGIQAAAVTAVRQALVSTEPAVLEWHYGRCALAADRDRLDGRRFVVGYNPDRTADDTLLVGRVSRPDGSCLATLTNYACHPTTLAWDNRLVSPDYVGAMRETIEDQTGGAPALFLQGASGELAPRHQYVGDIAIADGHGRQLGYAVLATLADMNPPAHELVYDGVVESGAPLGVWNLERTSHSVCVKAVMHGVDLPLKDWTSAAELQAQYRACKDRTMAERLRRKLRIREALGDGDSFMLELFAWRLGDALLLGTMAESYSLVQQELRRVAAPHSLVWMNLINGSIGYLPPAERYNDDIYQVWQTPLACGSLELLIEAAKRAVAELFETGA